MSKTERVQSKHLFEHLQLTGHYDEEVRCQQCFYVIEKNSTISCSHCPFVEHVWHHDIREAVKYYFVDYLRQGRGGYPTNPYHFFRLRIVSANGGWGTPLIRNLFLTMAIFAILRWWQTCSAKCPLQVTMTRSRMRKIMMMRMTIVCTMIMMMMCR